MYLQQLMHEQFVIFTQVQQPETSIKLDHTQAHERAPLYQHKLIPNSFL